MRLTTDPALMLSVQARSRPPRSTSSSPASWPESSRCGDRRHDCPHIARSEPGKPTELCFLVCLLLYVQPVLKSEEPSAEDTAGPVTVLKGKSFKDLVRG